MIAALIGAFFDKVAVDQQSSAVQVKVRWMFRIIINSDVNFTAGRQAQYSSVSGERMVFGGQPKQVMGQQLRLDHVRILTLQGGQPFVDIGDTIGNGLDIFP